MNKYLLTALLYVCLVGGIILLSFLVPLSAIPLEARGSRARTTVQQKPGKKKSRGQALCEQIFLDFCLKKGASKADIEIEARPKFLRNIYTCPITGQRAGTGRCLELDMYCKKLKLALEFNGAQHYRRVHQFQTEEGFARQVQNDEVKAHLCLKEGIKLCVIPHTDIVSDEYVSYLTVHTKLNDTFESTLSPVDSPLAFSPLVADSIRAQNSVDQRVDTQRIDSFQPLNEYSGDLADLPETEPMRLVS